VKKTLFITVAWLALAASVASAGGISLAWNDCLGAGGATNRTFACDTNVGSNDLYVSFDPSVDLPDVNGTWVTIDVFTDGYLGALPSWWQFKNIGSCRRNEISAAPTHETMPGSCGDLWGGHAEASIAGYFVTAVMPSMPPYWAYILATVSVLGPSLNAVAVHPGTEYTALVVRINNVKTAGLGACAGCQQQICLALREVLLTTNNSSEFHMRNPIPYACPAAPGTFVTWQGSSTPTLNRTWGQLKSLYR